MIKIRKKHLIFFIITTILAILLFAFHSPYLVHKKIYCTADLVGHQNDKIIKINLTYNLSDNIGNISMVGELRHDNNVMGIISRNIISQYTVNDFNYRFTSESINTTSMDTLSDDVLKEYLPLFFIEPNQKLSLNIKSIKSGGWIISTNSVPFLMCNEI